MADMKQHPLSAAFPSMPEAELQALADDISKHGQREAGLLYQGMVLDGWHRYQACGRAGVEFVAVPLDGDEDPVEVALSRNLHRRHLTATQRAAALTACVAWRGPGRVLGTSAELTTGEMAKVADVSPRTIEQAKAGHRVGLGQEMKDGTVSAKTAAKVARLPAGKRADAVRDIKHGNSAPLAKPTKPPAPETVPRAKYDALVAELVEKDELIKDLRFELNDLNEIQKGDHAKQMALLRASLKDANRARDDAMNDANQKNKQCQHYLKELMKLGWKKK
jgi:hypothetical protein